MSKTICYLAIQKKQNKFTCLRTILDFKRTNKPTIFTEVTTSNTKGAIATFARQALQSLTVLGITNVELYIGYGSLSQDFYAPAKKMLMMPECRYSYTISQDLNFINAPKYPAWYKVKQLLGSTNTELFIVNRHGEPVNSSCLPADYDHGISDESAEIISKIADCSKRFFYRFTTSPLAKAHNEYMQDVSNLSLFVTPSGQEKTTESYTINLVAACSSPRLDIPLKNINNIHIQCRYLALINNATQEVIPLPPPNRQTAKIIHEQKMSTFDASLGIKYKRIAIEYLIKYIAENEAKLLKSGYKIDYANIDFLFNNDWYFIKQESLVDIRALVSRMRQLSTKKDKAIIDRVIQLIYSARTNNIPPSASKDSYLRDWIKDAQSFCAYASSPDNYKPYFLKKQKLHGYNNYCITRYNEANVTPQTPLDDNKQTSPLQENTFAKVAKSEAFDKARNIILDTINSLSIDDLSNHSKDDIKNKIIAATKEVFESEFKIFLEKTLKEKHDEEQQELKAKQETEKQQIARMTAEMILSQKSTHR